jgi:hypothetical protein
MSNYLYEICLHWMGAGVAQSLFEELQTGWPGFHSCHGKIFLSSTASRPTVRPTQPPIQRVPGVLSPGEADH